MKNRKNTKRRDSVKNPYLTLLEKYKTENTCLDAIFYARAAKDSTCIGCGKDVLMFYKKINGRKGYQCKICMSQVYPLAGTILENTHIKLHIWLGVLIDKIVNHSGISANSVAYKYTLSNGSAWKLLDRVRQWMALTNEANWKPLEGYVECDEVAICTGTKGLGRKRKMKRGFGSHRMTPFLTMVQRDGGIKSVKIDDRERYTLLPLICDNVKTGSIICTDELRSYNSLSSLGYQHKVVNHSKNEYKNGDATTNRAEGYFGIVKPTITGTYRNISDKHSQKYMEEYDFRYNNRELSLEEKFNKLLNCLPPLFEHVRTRKAA
ncbi:MAG: IS1595 family transposase [Sporocytophaga sp.]|nr:IS1595 family transposase [Sporocytophaga sp.]